MKKFFVLYFVFTYLCGFSQDTLKIHVSDSLYVAFEVFEDDNGQKDSLYNVEYEKRNDFAFLRVFLDVELSDVLFESYWKGDTLITKQYYPNNRLKRYSALYQGYDLVYEELYCDNGQLIFKNRYNVGVNKVVNYYCSGLMKKMFFLNKVFLVGMYYSWYDNGILKERGEYDERGNKTGRWIYYTKNGEVENVEEH